MPGDELSAPTIRAVDKDQVETMLQKIRELPPEEFERQEKADLLKYLGDQGVELSDEFKKEFSQWPQPVQGYVSNALFDYARSHWYADRTPADTQVIVEFLEYALTGSRESRHFPKRVAEAQAAVAHQLSKYYGCDPEDDELPCWRK